MSAMVKSTIPVADNFLLYQQLYFNEVKKALKRLLCADLAYTWERSLGE